MLKKNSGRTLRVSLIPIRNYNRKRITLDVHLDLQIVKTHRRLSLLLSLNLVVITYFTPDVLTADTLHISIYPFKTIKQTLHLKKKSYRRRLAVLTRSLKSIASDPLSAPNLSKGKAKDILHGFSDITFPVKDSLTEALVCDQLFSTKIVEYCKLFSDPKSPKPTPFPTANPTPTEPPIDTDRYSISSCDELQGIAADLNGNYTLDRDIDCSQLTIATVGAGFQPIGTLPQPFTGILRGNGHTIQNLVINLPPTKQTGLFGVTRGALVENLSLRNVQIVGHDSSGIVVGSADGNTILRNIKVSGKVVGSLFTGGIAGFLDAEAMLSKIHAEIELQGTDTVGGLVGYNLGEISRSAFEGSVTGSKRVGGITGESSGLISDFTASVTISGGTDSGGAVGENSGIIRNGWVSGQIAGTYGVGGITGYNDESLDAVFFTGRLSGTEDVGAVIGTNEGGIVTSAYWKNLGTDGLQSIGYNEESSPQCFRITAGIQYFYDPTHSPLNAWNFSEIWKAVGGGFPELVGRAG